MGVRKTQRKKKLYKKKRKQVAKSKKRVYKKVKCKTVKRKTAKRNNKKKMRGGDEKNELKKKINSLKSNKLLNHEIKQLLGDYLNNIDNADLEELKNNVTMLEETLDETYSRPHQFSYNTHSTVPTNGKFTRNDTRKHPTTFYHSSRDANEQKSPVLKETQKEKDITQWGEDGTPNEEDGYGTPNEDLDGTVEWNEELANKLFKYSINPAHNT